MSLLSGYKSYIIAAFIVFVGVAEGLVGIDLPGISVGDDWVQWVVAGLGLGSLRDAIRVGMNYLTGK